MNRRELILAATAPVLASLASGQARAEDATKLREFAFILTRFNYLLLTTDNAGYRLCLVKDSKLGEVMRTSFNGFTLKEQSTTAMSFDWRSDEDGAEADGQVSFIALKVRLKKDPGERSNRNINYGPWTMTVSGFGLRFETLKKLLLDSRVSELWIPEDSMVFRGNLASEEFDDDFLHQ